MSHDTVLERVRYAAEQGATQIMIQGGVNPELRLAWFETLFRRVVAEFPGVDLHSLSVSEIAGLAQVESLSPREVLVRLKEAGMKSLPGAGAEILVERVRKRISARKIAPEAWIGVMREAQLLGMPTTATMMFGSIETDEERIEHLRVIRDLQRETGGFTEFVLLPFQVERNALGRHYGIRRSPSLDEVLRYTAIARLYFGADIPNIQSSWVKLGPDGVAETLRWGANDFGGTLMEESISRASGADHGQNLEAMEIEHWIRQAGRIPRERTTTYGAVTERPRDRERPLRALPLSR
jgi:CofH subfamily radical SAM domain protein